MTIGIIGAIGYTALLIYACWALFHKEREPVDAVAELMKSVPEIAIKPKQRFEGIDDDERYMLIDKLKDLFTDAIHDLYKEDPRAVAGRVGNEMVPYMFFDIKKGE